MNKVSITKLLTLLLFLSDHGQVWSDQMKVTQEQKIWINKNNRFIIITIVVLVCLCPVQEPIGFVVKDVGIAVR